VDTFPVSRTWRAVLAAAATLFLVAGAGMAAQAQDEPLKVALVLPGSASDRGFNQSAFESLAELESRFGAETAYTENTPVPEFERAYRDYADQGYDVIIGQGFEFGDVTAAVAPDFPDTYFIVTNNPDVAGPNMEGIQPLSHQSAYLAGVAAAMASESGKLGGIAGFEFPVIVAQMEAFRLGAQSVNPDADVRIAYLGSFEDVEKGKETARAMVSDGVDVIYHIADAAGVGVIEGAAEGGAKAIGWGKDQSDIAPDAVLTSQIVDQQEMIVEAVQAITDGTFTGEPVFYGLDTPVTGLAPITAVEDAKAAEIEAKVAEVRDQIIAGSLEVPFIPEPQG
jgi:basic membrane protein A